MVGGDGGGGGGTNLTHLGHTCKYYEEKEKRKSPVLAIDRRVRPGR